MDKNVCFLEGRIFADLKFNYAVSGVFYATFVLEIRTPMRGELAEQTEADHARQLIRVFVYDRRSSTYLKKIGAKVGDRVTVFARLASKQVEVGGKKVMMLNVIARDVKLIKQVTENGLQTGN